MLTRARVRRSNKLGVAVYFWIYICNCAMLSDILCNCFVVIMVTRAMAAGGTKVWVAEFGTSLSGNKSEEDEYIVIMQLLLDAYKPPKILETFINTQGILVRILEVTGDVGKMALARIRACENTCFVLKWYEDAYDNGLLVRNELRNIENC